MQNNRSHLCMRAGKRRLDRWSDNGLSLQLRKSKSRNYLPRDADNFLKAKMQAMDT